MTDYRQEHAIEPTWPAAERLLVCVGPSPLAPSLVRATGGWPPACGRRGSPCTSKRPRDRGMSEAGRQRLAQTLHLAEQLGAETVTLSGPEIADELVAFARRGTSPRLSSASRCSPGGRNGCGARSSIN